MPEKDKQILITQLLGNVLGEKPQLAKRFEWFVNKHTFTHFQRNFSIIEKIFNSLGGNITENQKKRTVPLECDAFFGGRYNFIFEFDEFQHFTSMRERTFAFYPKSLRLNFGVDQWTDFCLEHKYKADKYRKAKTTKDFNFFGGRAAQRAYLDCFRDLLPAIHDLNPTLRINEFEVEGITSMNKSAHQRIEDLLKDKIS